MSSTITTEERVNNFINAINDIIQFRLEYKRMNEDEANVLREMLIRIRTDTALLAAITNFNNSFLTLKANWDSINSYTSSISPTSNANLLNAIINFNNAFLNLKTNWD